MLEDRRSEVLRALVEEHIRTGEPVSSRAILEHTALSVSAATVRNDLAALEQEGYVVQPHTSAGRIPTGAAYRYYVDHLNPGRLRQPAQARISTFFGEVHVELSKLLKETSDLLAELTDLPSVVVAPGVGHDRIRSLHTVQVTTDQILVILITEGGRVVQQRGRVRVPITPQELSRAQQLMATEVVGTELVRVGEPPSEAMGELDEPTRESVLTISDCLHLAATGSAEVFVGGTQRMTAAWQDPGSIERILEILEREAEVMKLLAGASAISIQLGSDLAESGVDMAVVSKSYDVSGDAGSLGVIGPMRMNYQMAISAVEEVSKELEEQFGSTSN